MPYPGGFRLPRLWVLKAPFHLGPVHDVPPGVEVGGALVLVLEVIRVLPDVNSQQRKVALGNRRVLVRSRIKLEAGAVPDEPGPATAETLDAAVVDLRLELLERAERVVDRRAQCAARLAAPVRAHDLPEEGVVGMAAGVVADGRPLVLRDRIEAREHGLDGCVGPLGPFERGVRVRNVRAVVKVVVDAHRLGVDMRLERVVGVRQVGQLKGHFVVSSQLHGISRAAVEAHYKLYEGYVAKRNEILGRLADADLAAANQTFSDLRALKVDLTFAIGGIKNHELYFGHLGGAGGAPEGAFGELVARHFGPVDAWRADLKATGMAGRGWAWTAYDWDEGRLFNYLADAQNTYPIWNATPLIALDVYEHAYFLDYQTDRASYIDAFFDNLDWSTINDWVSKYNIQK